MTARQIELFALAAAGIVALLLARLIFHGLPPLPFILVTGSLVWLAASTGALPGGQAVRRGRLWLRRRYDTTQAVVDVIALRLADPDETWLAERTKQGWKLSSDDAVVRIKGDQLAVSMAGVVVPTDTVQTAQLSDAVLARLAADDHDALHGAVRAYRERRQGRDAGGPEGRP